MCAFHIHSFATALSPIIASWSFGLRGFWLSRPLLVSFRGILVYELFYFRALGIDSLNFTAAWLGRVFFCWYF
jgi:hypothetical protein